MYSRGDKEFIIDMFLASKKILKYTEGMSFVDFINDEKTFDAVIRNFEILGEAVKNISKGFKEKYPEIEWKKVAGTRDKLIHFYFGIDKEIVWDTIKKNIPELLKRLKAVIQAEGWEGEIED